MRVQVRLFASLREAVQQGVLVLDLPDGATAEAAWEHLVAAHPGLASRRGSLAVAVNRSYVLFDAPLSTGDEVVFIPPVGGG